MRRYHALVLAGRRAGRDPFADARGVADRGLIDVAGTPMLLRVLTTLQDAQRVGPITITNDDARSLRAHPGIDRLFREERVRWRPAGPSPSGSVADALEARAPGERLFVTTADHPLLTPEIVDRFLEGEPGDADVRVGTVAESVVRASHPDARRTWIRLRGGAFCGANLFAFETPEALRAARFWRRAESFRKRPWRLVLAVGPGSLALFLARRLDLDAAAARVSRAIGARVRAVPLPFAEAAVDVDTPEDLALAERILRERHSARSPSSRKQPALGS